jgi:preprotein translocase subunit Sss1
MLIFSGALLGGATLALAIFASPFAYPAAALAAVVVLFAVRQVHGGLVFDEFAAVAVVASIAMAVLGRLQLWDFAETIVSLTVIFLIGYLFNIINVLHNPNNAVNG